MSPSAVHDGEISLLRTIQQCLNSRVEADKRYSSELHLLASKRINANDVGGEDNPLYQAWQKLMEKTENKSRLIKDHAERIQTDCVERLNELIADKNAAKAMFNDDKNDMISELNQARDEIRSIAAEYQKSITKLKAKKKDYDDLVSKGKTGNKLEDPRRKCQQLAEKTHEIHNKYCLAVANGTLLYEDVASQDMTTRLENMWISAQSEYCRDTLLQIKTVLTEYMDISLSATKETSKLEAEMKRHVSDIATTTDYLNLQNTISGSYGETAFSFDEHLLTDYTGPLKMNELLLDRSTYDELTNLSEGYMKKMGLVQPDIDKYHTQIKTTKSEMDAIPFDVHKKLLVPKRRHLKKLERRLEGTILKKSRYEKLLAIVTQRLESAIPEQLENLCTTYCNGTAGAEGFPPSSPDSAPPPVKPRRVSESSDMTNNTAGATGGGGFLDKLKQKTRQRTQYPSVPIKPKKRPVREEYCVVTPGSNQPIQMTSNPDLPLEEEEWFHGLLPRDEVQRLLKEDGDYLVRESKKRNTDEMQYVLSVMWQGPKHFIIQSAETGTGWRLEGLPHATIQQLIIQQHKSGTAVTNRSKAVLTHPIMRENWQIKNDDIQLMEKIGNGNFGEVFKGLYNGETVAVKTCKAELSDDQKKKFIGEGRILRQYDHPNIVRFVGIAAYKNPVMIVMEYISGGALLSWLRKNSQGETNKTLVQMCLDAAEGMDYLESKGVIHRDLAARNCLISDSKKVKISDFGMSKEENEYTVTEGLKQIPIKWTAPEALNLGRYTSLCDVWSFGILMWEVFSSGKTPYPGMRNHDAKERVDNGYRMQSPENCPHAVYTLMRDCWEEVPERRPHFNKIVFEIKEILKDLPR